MQLTDTVRSVLNLWVSRSGKLKENRRSLWVKVTDCQNKVKSQHNMLSLKAHLVSHWQQSALNWKLETVSDWWTDWVSDWLIDWFWMNSSKQCQQKYKVQSCETHFIWNIQFPNRLSYFRVVLQNKPKLKMLLQLSRSLSYLHLRKQKCDGYCAEVPMSKALKPSGYLQCVYQGSVDDLWPQGGRQLSFTSNHNKQDTH